MIQFDKLHAEGFGSVHNPMTFQLDLGMTLSVIRGNVGSGKTSIPAILYYTLYGKHLKEKASVETWPELRLESYRGTKTHIEYYIDGVKHEVIRCSSFKGKISVGNKKKVQGSNNLFYLIDGELATDKKGKNPTQELIEKNLGYSAELFKNSIVFGQKMKRIIEESGPAKKKVFEEAFEVGFIEEAKDNTIAEKTKLQQSIQTIKTDIEKIEDKLDNKNDSLEAALDLEENFENNKSKRVKEIEEDLKEVKTEIKEFKLENATVSKNNDISNSISKLSKEIQEAKNKNTYIENCNKIIADNDYEIIEQKKVIKKKPKLCPSCEQPLSDKGYKAMVNSAKKSIETLVAETKKLEKNLKGLKVIDLKPLEVKLDKFKQQKAIQESKELEIEKNKTKLLKLKEKKDKLEKKLKEAEKETIKVKSPIYKKQIKNLEIKHKKLNKELSSLQKSLEIKEWLINDPLSNNGLKAYMFDNLMSKVNDRLDDYAKILGFQVEFGIDLASHRKDFYQAIMKDDIVIPYEDLSGGQKQLVDTSIAFAIHDVISDLRPVNIMFLDEPFESLGNDEIEIVADLVQEKARDKSLFLITHHQSFNPINVNDITVELDENKHTVIS
jgi:DNA repair exonuclease SbcCD ATPase subunit